MSYQLLKGQWFDHSLSRSKSCVRGPTSRVVTRWLPKTRCLTAFFYIVLIHETIEISPTWFQLPFDVRNLISLTGLFTGSVRLVTLTVCLPPSLLSVVPLSVPSRLTDHPYYPFHPVSTDTKTGFTVLLNTIVIVSVLSLPSYVTFSTQEVSTTQKLYDSRKCSSTGSPSISKVCSRIK